jgi:hypothetical protein
MSTEKAVAYFKYYSGICLEVLKKLTNCVNENSRSPRRDVKPRCFEYEAAALTTRRRL